MLSKYRVKKSPLKEKRKKLYISIALVLCLFVIAYGIYNFTKMKPADGQKEEVKIETGDRPLPKKITIYINADKSGLSLRKDRNSTSDRLTIIPDKTKLEVTDELDGWYKVSYEGKEGWIAKQYTTLDVPTEDPYSKWTEYKNTAYKIKYPEGWKVHDYGQVVAFSNLDLPASIPQGSDFIAPIIIKTADGKVEDIQKEYSGISGSSSENITISNFPGVKYTYTSPSSNTQVSTVVVAAGSKVYIFSEAGGYLDDLLNMLKTFQVG